MVIKFSLDILKPLRFILLFTLSLVLSCCSIKNKTEVKQPNIVVLVADDLGWKDVGFHGSDIMTPSIDRLAQSGARLNQFYVMPACTPTRASLLTGRYPMRYGMQITVVKPRHKHGIPLDERLLSEALKEVGYETAITGKWHLGMAKPEYLPSHRGFDHQYGCYTGMIDYVTHARHKLDLGPQLVVLDELEKPSEDILGHDWYRNEKPCYEKGYVTDLIQNEAVKIINGRNKTKPLFLYVPFTAPHIPLQATDTYVDMYQGKEMMLQNRQMNNENKEGALNARRYFAAMVTNMDHAIGEILDALEKQGMTENTLVVFFSDNGGLSWGGANNDPFRGYKTELYEGGVRTPAAVSFPNHIKPGTVVDEPLHVVDLYPTLLEISGASLQQLHPLDGKNIWASLTEGKPSPHNEIVLNAREDRSSAILVGDWKLVKNGNLGPTETIAEGKAAMYELFNLVKDPEEKNNLKDKYPEKFKELSKRVEFYIQSAAEPLVTTNPPADGIPPKRWEPNWWKKVE